MAFANWPKVDSLLNEAKKRFSTNKNEAYQLELQALQLATEVGYSEGIVKANYYLGFYFNSQDDLPSAIVHYLDAVKVSSDLTDSTSLGWALFANMNLGSILREHQIHNLADGFTNQGILLSEKIENSHQNIRLKFNLQKSYREQGRFVEALNTLDEIQILAEPGSKAYFQAYNGIGLVYKENKQFENGLSQFESLIPISKQEDNLTYLSYAYHNLADIYFKMNNFQDAEGNYKESIKIRLGINSKNTNILFQLYQGLAVLYMKLGDFTKANHEQLKAEALIPNVKGNQEYFYIYDDMSKVYSALNNMDKALFYSNLYQSELVNFLEKQSSIKTASQQYNMRMIVSNYYGELESQRKEEQSKAILMSIIVGLSTMLFLFVGYHFLSRYYLRRMLTQSLDRLKWTD